METVLNPYLPILIALAVAFVITAAATGLSFALGPKKPTAVKLDVYECGIPVTEARQKLSVKFYLTAILFILFDIETIFMYLWAVAFGYLGWFGVIEVGIFVAILAVGYVYILKRGALNWD